MSDSLQEVIDTLNELKRLHQLNFELMEQLNITCQWMIDTHVCIPNEEKIRSLLGKSLALLREIQADTPKILQYQKLADENLQHKRDSQGLDRTLKNTSHCM